jgi:hypothetical protein
VQRAQLQLAPQLQDAGLSPHLQTGAQRQGLHLQVLVISNLHHWVVGALRLDPSGPPGLNVAADLAFF